MINPIQGQCANENDKTTFFTLISSIVTVKDIYEPEEEGEDIQSQVKIAKLYSAFVYWCQPNNCNNLINAILIDEAVSDHYNMSAMYEVLKIEIEKDVEDEDTSTSTEKSTTSHAPDSTSTKGASTATSNVTTTKQPNNIATSLHISIIMIIFNTLLLFFLKFM
jgi:hypothetical protein